MSSQTPAPETRGGPLGALARACAYHPVRTIIVWALALVAIVLSSQTFGGALVNEFSIPGSESQSAVDLLQEKFPERAGDSAQIVFARLWAACLQQLTHQGVIPVVHGLLS